MFKYIVMILALVLFVSCSSTKKARKEVRQEVAANQVTDPKSLGSTIEDSINNSKSLNETQKQQLRKIFDSNKAKAIELAEQSYKLRGVLVEELLNGKANKKKISILKKEIKSVEAKRLKNTFEAIEQVTKIVSGDPNKEKFTNHLIGIDRVIR
jgi:uncharacterized protein YcfL